MSTVKDAKVGFTGSQTGMSREQEAQLCDFLEGYDTGTFHHGDCVGADERAARMAYTLNWVVACHPPDNSSKRAFTDCNDVYWPAKPYRQRNTDIVRQSEILIACPAWPEDHGKSKFSGTWMTVRIARKLGVPVIVYPGWDT